jgi:hypothetical protein
VRDYCPDEYSDPGLEALACALQGEELGAELATVLRGLIHRRERERRLESFKRAMKRVDERAAVAADRWLDLIPHARTVELVRLGRDDTGDPRVARSDGFDILNSALLPYVEAFITERHQREVLRKTTQCDDFLGDLQVFVLQDFRGGAPKPSRSS